MSLNAIPRQGLSPGVYTLNVDAGMPSSGILNIYETILVVLAPNQQPLPPTTVISQITIEETAVCPTNLILINGNCTEPLITLEPTPTPRPTDYCSRILLPPEQFEKYCEDEGVGKGERPICTPDGPECPPCPEGVEAGWCADEDERQDTDEELPEEGQPEESEGDGETFDPPSMFEGNENGNGEGNGGNDGENGGDEGGGGDGEVPSEFG